MPFSYDINPDDSSRIRRRSQRIESKENSERIEFKALGQNLGQLARGAVAFDPNAEDGDGDGLVQDNTPYERPAVLSDIANTVRQGLASATGNQRYFTNGKSPTVGMTNREVAEYAVPDNPLQFLEMRLQQQAILGISNDNPFIQEDLDKLSFDPEGIEQLRNLVEQTLDERPALRVAWDRFGVPPIGISEGKNNYMGVFLYDSILIDDDSLKAKPIKSKLTNSRMLSMFASAGMGAPDIKGVKRALVSADPRDTITHEWGHYLQHLTERLHPDANTREIAALLDARRWSEGLYHKQSLDRHPQIRRLFDYFAEVDKTFTDKNEAPDDSIPFVFSAYATTQPSEFVAEAITAYFSPDKKTRELLNDAGVDLVEKTFLGIRGGLASTSSGRRTTTGNSMRGLTPAEMAERIVPSTLEEALLSIADHQRMMAIDGEDVNAEALKVAIPRGMDDIDFSPEAVAEMREVVTKALAENRMFREVAERHGFPPVLATKRDAEWVDGDGTYAISMIEGFPSIIVNRDTRNQMLLSGGAPNGVYEEEGMLEGTNTFLVSPTEDSMIAHEWGHYINRLAASSHPDEDVRALAAFWFSDTWDHDAGLTGPWKVLDKLGINVGEDKVSQRIIGARRFSDKVKNSKSEKWTGYPHVLSQYGQTMPAEAFAEGVSAILVGDESARGLVSPALRDDIFDIIGKPPSYQRDITGGISKRNAGLASFSMPRDIFGGIIVPQSASDPGAERTPIGGRDWLKDATNEEIADSLAVRSLDDFVALTLMNMMYGKDPSTVGRYRQALEAAIAQSFFPELRGAPSHFIDFSPQGVDRTRQIIKNAVDASPTFAWILRTFGSVPIVSTDPDAVDQMLMMQMLTRQQIGSEEINNPGIMGWSLSMLGIVLNTASIPGRERHKIGQRQRASAYTYNENLTLEEFLTNVDLSMEGTLYHEWFHSFYDRVLGWHKAIGGAGAGLPGERQDRQGYLYPGVSDVDRLTELLKKAFDSEAFIPYSSTDSKLVDPIIAKAKRKISRNNDTDTDFNRIMAEHDARVETGWTPEMTRRTLAEIEARYPYLLDDLAPLLRVNYGTASRQEQFAEGGTLFVTPDTRQRSNFLPPETESLYAYLLGLKPDPSVGDYQKPWQERSGLASRSSFKQSAISSLNERVHTGKELFVQAGEAHRRPDVVKQSGGITDVSINGYKFSIMGELPDFDEAYEAWNDWQENWRMRYISSEIMGLGALSSQADTRAWQSIANNHIKNGTINEASSSTREEIQRSAMMALSMMKEISDSPYATDAPLYRSINNVAENDAIARLNVGETLSMPLTSFSPDYASVLGFSKNNDQTTIRDAIGERSNVVVKLREGTSVAYSSLTKPTPDTDGREVNMPIEAITAGEFVVKSKTNVNGVDVVEIEQSRVIDPLRGSRATDGRKKVETNKRRIKLNQDMTKSLEKIREKVQAREDAATDDERNKIDDDIAFESKRYGAITRALRTQNDDFDKLDTPRTVGGLASASSLEDRASRHGVSLEAFNDEDYDADDIEWSTNDWSFGKTGQVRAGDVVVVRTRNDGKKEILTIERKSGPFRGALSLPGGLQDEGEDLYDTAEREMLEEVNVSPTDAMDRRILGQVDVKDWDPRFVEGGRIAGIRFDLSEEQSSVVKAGDDAGKFNWIDVEEMSTGKYPIAFGHASWLAEAFADDEVLGPRFAVLAEASRVRNQRLIKKIDEKRREKGVKEFGEMPDPSVPYTTTTEGIRTGLASARSGIKDISQPRHLDGSYKRLMRDNIEFLNNNPINDGYYGRVIDGAWVKNVLEEMKRGKISHEDAVGIYLALTAINDGKVYDSADSINEAFYIRQALKDYRDVVSGNQEHYVSRHMFGNDFTYAAHRGQDYLGDFKTEEEALSAIQDSIADRTMIGPTRPVSSGLASTSENKFSGIKTEYAESLDRDIADAGEYISRLESALDDWNETGVWRGADYDVVLTPGRPTKNMTRQEMLDIDYNPDNFAGAIQQRIGELNNELSNMRAARSRLDKQGDSTTPIEAILADPETLARIEKRAEEMRSMPRPDRADFFQDGEYVYVVHWGSDVLDGGVLDPSRSRGDENSANVTGNTRRLNRVTGMQLVAKRDDQKQKLADLTKIQEEFEKTGLINLSVAGNPSGVQQIIGYLISRGKSRNARYDGDKAYRPFPDADDLKELGIDELTPEMIERISENLSNSVKGAEQRFKSLDAVADRLIADNYQYSSTYPAADLETANGYGGRYGDDAQEWGNSAPLSSRAGIHVFRVRLGEDATTETGGPGEIHIVGQHAPIASLSIETHRNRGNQPTSAQFTWQGWLAEVVEADKKSRSDGAESAITLSEDGRMPDMPERDVRGKSIAWVELSTKSFINDAPSFELKSLNYTKPELRERIKNRIMAGSKGGKPGQWSARKAQLLAMEYRKAGGGYGGGLRKTQRSLKKWTREKWTTSDGKPAIRKGGTRRYLPASAWSKLTPAQRRATNRKKIIGSRAGNQFVANTRSAENASRQAR
jgi:8-oxo-dGTP pyrophosphatase MutT (NUDIX family)